MEQNLVALVIPCFNEFSRDSQKYWNDIVGNKNINFIFVDDGSSDSTYDELEVLSEANTNVTILKNSRNLGKAATIRNGIIFALHKMPELEHIGYLDADGAFSTKEVQRIVSLAFFDSVDCIWSSRVLLSGRDLKRNFVRHYLGRIVATFLSFRYSSLPYDTQSGLKIMKVTSSFRNIWVSEFKTRWFVDLEMLLRWRKLEPNLYVWEEPVQYWHEIAGSKITTKEIFRLTFEVLRILIKYPGKFI